MLISKDQYHTDIKLLLDKIVNNPFVNFDCIVAIKRSGLILSVMISENTGKQIFVDSEVKNIPDIFKNVLLVDDKIYTGKTFSKIKNKLLKLNKNVTTVCLYVEGCKKTDYYVKYTNKILKIYYENMAYL